jgi:simple sugar transport system substrate-binding protein
MSFSLAPVGLGAEREEEMSFQKLLKTATALACFSVMAAAVGLTPARAEGKINIIMDGGPLWDPFFGAMKKGGEDAAKDLGVEFQWVTSTDTANFDTDYAKLVKQSASRHPSALIIGNYFPHALDPIIKDITAAGEPVFIFHDGGASWKEDGAIGYIGFDSYALGKRVAGLSIKAGAKHGLCVNHVPGNVTLENECKGYEEAFKEAGGSAKLEMIQFSDAYNPTFVTQAIKGQLQSDQTIDAVYTMGAEQGLAAAAAIEQLGKKDKIVNGSLGLSLNALQALHDGKILFIADLQPYLDGYYAVVEAYQYAKFGMLPAGEIWTGAQILTKDNADKVLDINKKFPGVRGAS